MDASKHIKASAISAILTTSLLAFVLPNQVFAKPFGIAVNSNYVYVANYRSNTMTGIDGKTNTVVNTVPVGTSPSAIAINPTTNKIYVANSVIDVKTKAITNTFSTPKIGPINDSASRQYEYYRYTHHTIL